MNWLRWLLGGEPDVTDVERAEVKQRERFDRWDAVVQSIRDTEAAVRGERRHADRGHRPERRHG